MLLLWLKRKKSSHFQKMCYGSWQWYAKLTYPEHNLVNPFHKHTFCKLYSKGSTIITAKWSPRHKVAKMWFWKMEKTNNLKTWIYRIRMQVYFADYLMHTDRFVWNEIQNLFTVSRIFVTRVKRNPCINIWNDTGYFSFPSDLSDVKVRK